MIIKNILLASESFTHNNWVYKDISVGFSRLYYIIDGEGYYEQDGKTVRFKKGHLYLTPVRQRFTLYENPDNKLLHTYCHIVTMPEITHFVEIEVKPDTPLADAVLLWRKYIRSKDNALIISTAQFLVSLISEQVGVKDTVADKAKHYLDTLKAKNVDMSDMSASLGYSREHITRAFCSVYRLTPKQYFNSRRMNAALTKLCEGETVKTVADRLGFCSPYSFSKAFKKHFGLSPTKYIIKIKSE